MWSLWLQYRLPDHLLGEETILLEDVKEFEIREISPRSSSLGFKVGRK